MKRIAWGITGGGQFLEEAVDWLTHSADVDIFLSRAAEEVVRMYDLEKLINNSGARVVRESRVPISAPQVARFSRGVYSVFLVAPASGNTVAKFVYGIADTLITNLFAQAGKSRVPIVVLPTDVAKEIDSPTPKGGTVMVYPRRIDLENTARLGEMEEVTVATNLQELQASLQPYLSAKAD